MLFLAVSSSELTTFPSSIRSLRSIPEQKTFPLPESIITRQSGSLPSKSKASPISLKNTEIIWVVPFISYWELSLTLCMTYDQSCLFIAFIFFSLFNWTLYTNGLVSTIFKALKLAMASVERSLRQPIVLVTAKKKLNNSK